MSSTRVILIFLGFIFIIIILLSSTRISNALRQRFGKFLPNTKISTARITPTPTLSTEETNTPSPTLTSTVISDTRSTRRGEIPATGPNDILWLILGTTLVAGVTFRKITAAGFKG